MSKPEVPLLSGGQARSAVEVRRSAIAWLVAVLAYGVLVLGAVL